MELVGIGGYRWRRLLELVLSDGSGPVGIIDRRSTGDHEMFSDVDGIQQYKQVTGHRTYIGDMEADTHHY